MSCSERGCYDPGAGGAKTDCGTLLSPRLSDVSYNDCRCAGVRMPPPAMQDWLSLKGITVMQKQIPCPDPADAIDDVLHAIALQMLRRQMKGRWSSVQQPLPTAV